LSRVRTFQRALVVEDDAVLATAIRDALLTWGTAEVRVADRVATALASLDVPFDLLLIDVRLPDGSGIEVARRAAASRPAPQMIAITGEATRMESFELGRLGSVAFVTKPFSLAELRAAIDERGGASLSAQAVAQVGARTLRDVGDEVRHAMLEQAIALTGGNRTETAALLGVTRQAVQKMLRDRRSEPA
jgi:DNA-binding NtrC family response regulator